MTEAKLDIFLCEIKSFANPVRAVADKRYHKSHREHWGVSAPQCALLVKSFSKDLPQEELILLAQALWKTNIFDAMACAYKIMSLPKVIPSDALWKSIKTFLKDVDGWALEDGLAHAAWKCILADRKLLDELEKWTTHANFWMRRATLVYTLPFAKPGQDPERMLTWASEYADDSEWFIQKAIGWWLRVLGQHNPDRVILFLNSHWTRLKTVARKEATRKLTEGFKEKVKLFK